MPFAFPDQQLTERDSTLQCSAGPGRYRYHGIIDTLASTWAQVVGRPSKFAPCLAARPKKLPKTIFHLTTLFAESQYHNYEECASNPRAMRWRSRQWGPRDTTGCDDVTNKSSQLSNRTLLRCPGQVPWHADANSNSLTCLTRVSVTSRLCRGIVQCLRLSQHVRYSQRQNSEATTRGIAGARSCDSLLHHSFHGLFNDALLSSFLPNQLDHFKELSLDPRGEPSPEVFRDSFLQNLLSHPNEILLSLPDGHVDGLLTVAIGNSVFQHRRNLLLLVFTMLPFGRRVAISSLIEMANKK